MGLESLHPYEFEKLHNTYTTISNMFTIISKKKDLLFKQEIPNQNILHEFMQYISNYTTTFDLHKMKSINLNTNKDEIINYFNQYDVILIKNTTLSILFKYYDPYYSSLYKELKHSSYIYNWKRVIVDECHDIINKIETVS